MNKIKRKNKILILTLIALILAIIVYKMIPDEDHVVRSWPRGIHGIQMTNLAKADYDIENQMNAVLSYIENCKRFPLNLEDSYALIKNPPKHCHPLITWFNEEDNAWNDPWGRSYQIRYHYQRMKFQMRSHGRNIDDLADDIVREVNYPTRSETFKSEELKCKTLSKEDKSCIFNRGWH